MYEISIKMVFYPVILTFVDNHKTSVGHREGKPLSKYSQMPRVKG